MDVFQIQELINLKIKGYPLKLDFREFYIKYHTLDPLNKNKTIEYHEISGMDIKDLVKDMEKRLS